MTQTAPATASIPRPWNRLTRLIWLLFLGASVWVFLWGEALTLRQPLIDCPNAQAEGCSYNFLTVGDAQAAPLLGLPIPVLTWFFRGTGWVARLSMAVTGLVLFWRRPDDRVAWVMSLALLSALAEGVSNLGGFQVLGTVVYTLGTLAWMPLLFIFPNGRIEPRWLRWVVVVLTPALAVSSLSLQFPALLSPLWKWLGFGLILVGWVGLGGYSLVYRYRRVSNAIERQQTKWVIVGFFLLFITSTSYLIMSGLFPPWQPSVARLIALLVNGVLYALGYAGFSACVAIAILRYRLWDIDLLIRRTLLYSTLTVLLGLTYFGGVVALQQVFGGLTGSGSSNAAIIVTTLLIAALFQPLRRRLQDGIDRRFYRRKYDTARTLAAFAAAARDNVDLTELTERLQDTLDQTMQPAHSAVWLWPGSSETLPGPR